MKISSLIILVTGLLVGSALTFFMGDWFEHSFDGDKGNEKKILYWVAPMDPNYKRDEPGKSPMGMDLVPVYEEGEDNSGNNAISIRPNIENNLGVRKQAVERGKIWRRIDTVGYVGHNENRISHIHLRTQGWIENLLVKSEGERIKKSQLLFELYSPELVNAQEEYLQALRVNNKRLVTASKDRLAALGISDKQIQSLSVNRKVNQLVQVYAEQDGVVSTLNVAEGMYVKPATEVMSIVDLSSIWVLVEVFEKQSSWVSVGDDAKASFAFIPGKIWEGRVEYVYPELDASTRTLKVRLQFDNPDETLKPNMFGRIRISSAPKEDTLIIPAEALIRSGKEEHVVVSLGDGQYESRQVEAGIESDGRVEILHGLKEQDEVVTSAQFLIDSEASLKASFSRMEPEKKQEVVYAKGVVKNIDVEKQLIRIAHEPVEELGWPSMTMNFSVAGSALDAAEKLKVGSAVHFFMTKNAEEKYVISEIHVMDEMQ